MAGQAGLSSALPSEDLAREMFLLVHGKLTSSGFEHYEISNFAKRGTVPFSAGDCPPFRSRHNLNYWRYGSWLGIGPNATSFMNGSTRLTCSKDIKNYLAQNFIYETEDIPQKTAMAEFSFMGLRTSDGIDLSEFEQRFGIPFDARWPGLKEKWLAAKMASEKNACLALTVEGMLISDELFRELV
jgi:oxygen-independent coproporphyrinogen-3 oxidase